MKNTHNSQRPSTPNDALHWHAGPVLSKHKTKGFNRVGTKMKVIDMEEYVFEVFPPKHLAEEMQKPAYDIIHHFQKEGLDASQMNRRKVSFIARVSFPNKPENSSVVIMLKSEQRQNGGIYVKETKIPMDKACVRDTAIETALECLDNALHQYHWIPPY
ncbi:MAG: hypothetical protein ACXV7J_02805 [Methylomonas sp.]